MDDVMRWVVQTVILKGRHGPYAVATNLGRPELGPVTFSLVPEEKVWLEKRHPQHGSEVVLEDFQKKSAGWRAMSARFFRPEDIVNSNQQTVGSKQQ